ncbi:hypothetical protein [Micromonospora sp. NPDC005652]|uniref:hypothetical protein n=1 Tax=Micromonospora sp. NPDC005652 TaxID=3157046 RepID=UPI0033CCB83F
MRSTLTPAARAAAGARFMDRTDRLWYDVVDLDLLDIRDRKLCVYGQVTGDFNNIWDALAQGVLNGKSGSGDWLLDHGFYCQPTAGEEDDPEDEGDKAELEQAWRHEITMRRNLAPLAHALLAEAAA